ncbi:MAG TPA: D-alanyl-D-alanine endopeptidase [Moraxellaceae bacterium]|nr:D-alanyl-D-alanine endopeptidase [Moraxellaceae bacterium]
MRKTHIPGLRALLIGAISLGLSLPAVAAARSNDAPAKASVHKKSAHAAPRATGKKVGHAHTRSHKASRVSRYGKQRTSVARMSAAERQRLAAQANLPHRVGPTEVFQAPAAQSSLYLQSRAAVVMNAETGEVLYSKNSDRTMPIASITKLMTAMVVLDAHLPMDAPVTITEDDVDHLRNTSSRLTVGTTLPRHEMMLLALMSSENRAAAALARTYPGGTPAAVAAMNRKAQELGMTHAHFLDSTGLHSENSASPADLVRMVKAARNYPEIHEYTTTAEHMVQSGNGRTLQYRNTNALVKSDRWNIEVSKTGFINEAGKCLVMQARIQSRPVVIVLMDSAGRYTRIGDANRVKQWLETALDLSSTSIPAHEGRS